MVCGYDTAMNLWTSAMIGQKTVSLDKFEGSDMYLVREQNITRVFNDSTSQCSPEASFDGINSLPTGIKLCYKVKNNRYQLNIVPCHASFL